MTLAFLPQEVPRTLRCHPTAYRLQLSPPNRAHPALTPRRLLNPSPPPKPRAAASTSRSSRAKDTKQLPPAVLRFVEAERGGLRERKEGGGDGEVPSAHPARRPYALHPSLPACRSVPPDTLALATPLPPYDSSLTRRLPHVVYHASSFALLPACPSSQPQDKPRTSRNWVSPSLLLPW